MMTYWTRICNLVVTVSLRLLNLIFTVWLLSSQQKYIIIAAQFAVRSAAIFPLTMNDDDIPTLLERHSVKVSQS